MLYKDVIQRCWPIIAVPQTVSGPCTLCQVYLALHKSRDRPPCTLCQVYLALHKPRDHLRQPSPEPLPDAYKERLRESARPDLRDSGVTSLGLTCQCYGRDVTQVTPKMSGDADRLYRFF